MCHLHKGPGGLLEIELRRKKLPLAGFEPVTFLSLGTSGSSPLRLKQLYLMVMATGVVAVIVVLNVVVNIINFGAVNFYWLYL